MSANTNSKREQLNSRERQRMLGLNKAYDDLRAKIPCAKNRTLSKMETLQNAIIYIKALSSMVDECDSPQSQSSDSFLELLKSD